MDAQSGSRALNGANDLVELLRLTQGALERIEQEVHGASFEQAEAIGRDMQRLRRQAEKLQADIERFVSREETATVWRGHPLRRSADRASPPGSHP
jgi:hypothetical protein